MKPTVIYEDEYILGINKPPGLLVHPDGVSKEKTVIDWVGEHYPHIHGVGETLKLRNGEIIERHGVVHRLDRDTSGVLVITKTQESFLFLKEQFKNREVKKIYTAFVYGGFSSTSSGQAIEGDINLPIGKSRKDFRRWSAEADATGTLRESQTHFKVLKQGKDENEPLSFLEIFPKTGRTHQIRVHLKAVHHPIVCDSLYAQSRPCLLGFNRLALHASRITLSTPKKTVTIEAPLPGDFNKALEQLR